jgi:hypothetical protein
LFVLLVLLVFIWGLLWARFKPQKLQQLVELVDE